MWRVWQGETRVATALVIACVTCCVSPMRAQVAAAQPSVREELAELSEQEARLAHDLQVAYAAQAHLNGELSRNEQRVNELTAELALADAAVADADEKARVGADALADAKRRVANQRERLVDAVVARYAGTPLSIGLPTVKELKGDGARSVLARLAYGDTISRVQEAMLGVLRDESARQLRLSDDLDAARLLVHQRRDELQQRQEELAQQKALLETLVEQVEEQSASTQKLMGELAQQRADSLAQVSAMAQDSLNLGAALRAVQSKSPLAAVMDPLTGLVGGEVTIPRTPTRQTFLDPGPRSSRSSGFGYRTHPLFGDVRMHTGVDYALDAGSTIRAGGAGIVIASQMWGGYGLLTVIDHGSGVATAYAHQAATTVEPGQRVAAGDVIGEVGSTGFATGPHLHFEVRVDGEPTNPVLWLS